MLYMYALDLHENILGVLTATGIISLTPILVHIIVGKFSVGHLRS